MGAATSAAGAEAVTIAVKEIVRDPTLQPRKGIDQRTVDDYAAAMKAGSVFPPVAIARTERGTLLVDGWHRMEAAIRNGEATVRAAAVAHDLGGARRYAALANLRHGKPVKRGEVQRALGIYINGRGHYGADGRLKTYEQITGDLGGHVNVSTVYRWIAKDFPSVARMMGRRKKEASVDGEFEGEMFDQSGDVLKGFRLMLRDLMGSCGRLNEADRCKAIEAMEKAAQKARKEPAGRIVRKGFARGPKPLEGLTEDF